MKITEMELNERPITTPAGETFQVPAHILRVDETGQQGWELRYGEWTFYPDAPAHQGGPAQTLETVRADLIFRLNTLGK